MREKHATLLDSNAGAPLHPVVREALFAFLNSGRATGNPASLHAYGRETSALMGEAARSILKTFHVSADDWGVVFTSGGTEANQLAVRSVLAPRIERGEASAWTVSEVEHACVLDLRSEMDRRGVVVRVLKTAPSGEVDGIDEGAEGAALLSVIGVGNETGIFQHDLTSHILCATTPNSENRPVYHSDFVAGWGKIDLDLSTPGAPDLVTLAGHKLGGLSGAGAIVHRKRIPVRRSGTPNLAGIVALKALADHWPDLLGGSDALLPLRDEFERELRARFSSVRITGHPLRRVPNVSSFYFPGLRKDLSLVAALDLRGFAVSAGSACASGSPEPSHVLRAMGLSDTDARNALRVSLHSGNTSGELAEFVDALAAILKRNEVR
jgi:cysteine desulfurase